MPTLLPASILAALKTSLANPAHAWVVRGPMEDSHEEQVLTGGDPDPIGFTTVTHINLTYQAQSDPLALILPITVEDTGKIKIYFHAISYETSDAPLAALLASMAASFVTNTSAELLDALT